MIKPNEREKMLAKDLTTWATGGVDAFSLPGSETVEVWERQFANAFADYRAELMEKVAKMVENEELECYECGTWYNFGPLGKKIRKLGDEEKG